MAGRTIWKGYIHFASLHVPVKLHTAVKEQRIQFHLIHQQDQARLQQQMVCSQEEVPVPREEQVKGYEIEEGKYVLVDPEELAEIQSTDGRMIEVKDFVKSGQIDPRYRDRVYYLEPDAGSRGFAALAEVLEETDLVGICTWTMRKRSYLGCLQLYGKTLRLITMRYADEVVPIDSLELPETALGERELKTGKELINHLVGTFEPQKYENEFQKKLSDLIEKKAKGEKIKIRRPRELKATTSDQLIKALEESLRQVARR